MIERFLTSGFEFGDDEHEQKLKYMLFNALLSLNIIVVFLASIARLLESNMVQFTIDILYCSSGLIILLLTRKYKDRFQLFVKIVMILSFIIVSLSFYFGMNSTVGTSWFVILLLVVVFLTDKKFSYFILLSSVAMIFYIFWIDTKHGYSLSSAFYSIIPLCVSCIFLYFYEKRNQTSKDMLLKQNKQLSNLTNNLQKLVDEEVEKNRKQFEVLAKQSQSAALGEMMDAIAHQWKQPLGTIKLYSESLAINASYGLEVTNEDIENSSKNINTQISHLINTIDEFRSFFRPNPELINVKISEVIDSTLLLMKDNLIQNQIEVETNGDKQLEFRCIPNEFKHIFINLINNSKDAFIDNKIVDKKIVFNQYSEDNKVIITICDNAGGIPSDVISDIFNSNFTTKSDDEGTGIGLYLTKQIIEKSHGEIIASNYEDGVCFKIILAG